MRALPFFSITKTLPGSKSVPVTCALAAVYNVERTAVERKTLTQLDTTEQQLCFLRARPSNPQAGEDPPRGKSSSGHKGAEETKTALFQVSGLSQKAEQSVGPQSGKDVVQ